MKRILAVLLPVILSTYLPMCAVVSLPACLVEKYVPQDLRESLQYGAEWFEVFRKVYGNDQPAAEPTRPVQVAAMINDSTKPKTECPFEMQQAEEPAPAVIAVPNVTITVQAPVESVDFTVPKLLEFNEKQFENDLRILIQQQVGLYQQDLEKNELHSRREVLRDQIRSAQKQYQQIVREIHETKLKTRKARTLL